MNATGTPEKGKIDLTRLSEVRTIVTHADCPDGIASAIILRDAIPGARIVFVQHGAPELRDIAAGPGMLFCDITPPRERVASFLRARAIVLDHHRSQRDITGAFVAEGLGIFADEEWDPGVSGAVLAYREVWCVASDGGDEIVRSFAELAGIRDTWQRSSPLWERACEQADALRFWPVERMIGQSWERIGEMMGVGEVLRQKGAERDRKSIGEAHRFTIRGVRCLAFEGGWTSDIAEQMASEVDLVLGWHYLVSESNPRIVVSLRSRGDVISALHVAKLYGGGGHVCAAGFTAPAPAEGPYQYVEHVVLNAVRSLSE